MRGDQNCITVTAISSTEALDLGQVYFGFALLSIFLSCALSCIKQQPSLAGIRNGLGFFQERL